MPKWTGFRWPPRSWWFGKPDGTIWTNHPVSHFLGGLIVAIVVMLGWALLLYTLGLGAIHSAVPFRLAVVAFISGCFEYGQKNIRPLYPIYSAVGGFVFFVLGAALVEVVLELAT